MPKYVEPSISLSSFNCPRCGALAAQTWYTSGAIPIDDKGKPHIPDDQVIANIEDHIKNEKTAEDRDIFQSFLADSKRRKAGEFYLNPLPEWQNHKIDIENLFISECYGCDQISLWLHNKLIFPVTNFEIFPNEDLDDEIKSDFEEAAGIVDASPRGAAALMRLCVQKLCVQAGEKGKNINKDIASLVKKGLDSRIQQALDIVRVTGNDAVHPGQIDLKDDKAIALELFNLVNLVATKMLSEPKQISEMYERLPESARKAIEKRDEND